MVSKRVEPLKVADEKETEKLFERLSKALEELLKAKRFLGEQRNKVIETGQKQEKEAIFLKEKDENLQERELKVKSIENIVVFKEAAEALAKANDKERISLDESTNKFNAFAVEEKAKITARQQELNGQEAFYKRELEALQNAKQDVEKEKSAIKAKVLGELAKNI